MRYPLRLAGGLLAAGLLCAAAPAGADVAGPDDSLATAYGPIQPDTTYAGRFVAETDVDYLAFDVARAGERLHFDVVNTVSPCMSLELTGCPVYGTLLDAGGAQLGGEDSGAGTGPVTDDSPADVIDWTFAAPGRYYLAMDAGADDPSYTVAYHEVPADPPPSGQGDAGTDPPASGAGSPGVTAGRGARTGRAIGSLRASPAAGGRAVRLRVGLDAPLRTLVVHAQDAAGRAVATRRRGPLAAGTLTLTLPLDAAARRALARRGTFTVRIRVTATPVSGPAQNARRTVRLPR